jgi:hypothetical protein
MVKTLCILEIFNIEARGVSQQMPRHTLGGRGGHWPLKKNFIVTWNRPEILIDDSIYASKTTLNDWLHYL